MSRAIDALIAARLIKLLVTPFEKTQAYKLGIIDDKGKVLIKSKDFTTHQQKQEKHILYLFVLYLISKDY